MSKRFRIKATLDDGRKIYVTSGPRFQLVDGPSELLNSFIKSGRYTKSLMLFGPFGDLPNSVGIKSADLEPEDSPVDPSAFILGGAFATTLASGN